MAEQKPTYDVRLYDANGMQTGTAEFDVDLSAATERGSVINHNGTYYVWHQRSGQWREASNVHKLGKSAVEEVVDPTVSAEPAPAAASTKK